MNGWGSNKLFKKMNSHQIQNKKMIMVLKIDNQKAMNLERIILIMTKMKKKKLMISKLLSMIRKRIKMK